MDTTKQTVAGPVAIGGVGGSGTRLIAEIMQELGFYIGEALNPQNDNLFFTLLLKRPDWFQQFPQDNAVLTAVNLFTRAMTSGLAANMSQSEQDTIWEIVRELENANVRTGAKRIHATQLIETLAPDFTNKIGWGWKEPNTHIFLPQLIAGIDSLKYIHVIRNGLDMAFSNNQAQAMNWGQHICGHDFPTNPSTAFHCLEYWIAANRRAIKIGTEQLGKNFLLINYDDFCANPNQGLAQMAAFLDAPLSPQKAETLTALFAPSSIGRYRNADLGVFSQAQISAVEELGFTVHA